MNRQELIKDFLAVPVKVGDAEVSGNAKVSGDAWSESPLQIQGTKHFFSVSSELEISIGCNKFTFDYWKENFKRIGKENGYSGEQIKEYGLYIDLAFQLYKK